MPDAPGLELILAGINAEHPGAVLDTSFDRDQPALIVHPDQVREVLTWLRDTEGQQYTFLASVHGADYLPAEPRFAVHYELLNRERYERLRVKALLPDPAATGAIADSGRATAGEGSGGAPGESRPTESSPTGANTKPLPHIASVTDIFPTAEFQEREVYDFFGIVFDGHPDPRRILMPEDYAGHPQRRDFPIGGEPVIFTRDEVTYPGWWN
ncbi:MAG: NADH-quinone oxidoreductase subunit C [Solirubrobacterales bacterium]